MRNLTNYLLFPNLQKENSTKRLKTYANSLSENAGTRSDILRRLGLDDTYNKK